MTFSSERGFFDGEVVLEIETADPNATIYVSTAWGSEWTPDEFVAVAQPYTGPIRITATTQVRAIAIGGRAPEVVESHTYISRATALGSAGPDSEAVRQALSNFPVIELSSPPPTAKGVAVPAVVEVFWPNGEQPGVSTRAGVRRQGNVAFSGQAAYHRLYFDYYGDSALEYDLFPDAPGAQTAQSYSHINLHGGATDSFGHAWGSVAPLCVPAIGVLMQDRFYQNLQREMTGDGVEGQYFLLFDRGVFIGVKNVEAVANQEYMAANFGGYASDYAVRQDDGAVGPAGALAVTDPANNPYLHRDLDNFIDYHLLEWLSGHTNWPQKNFITAGAANGPVYNWVWDNQVSRPSCLSNLGQTVGNWPIGDPDFDMAVADRVLLHFSDGGALSPASLTESWDQLAADLAPVFDLPVTQYAGGPYGRATWNAAQRFLGSELGPKSMALRVWLQSRGYVPAATPVTHTVTPATDDVGAARVLILTSPDQGADVYYTVDGTDPRAPGGGVAESALRYIAPVSLAEGTLSVHARSLVNGMWSAGLPETYVAAAPEHGVTIETVGTSVHLTNNGQAPVDLEYFRVQGDVRYKFDFARSPTLQSGESIVLSSADYLGELDGDQPTYLVDPQAQIIAATG